MLSLHFLVFPRSALTNMAAILGNAPFHGGFSFSMAFLFFGGQLIETYFILYWVCEILSYRLINPCLCPCLVMKANSSLLVKPFWMEQPRVYRLHHQLTLQIIIQSTATISMAWAICRTKNDGFTMQSNLVGWMIWVYAIIPRNLVFCIWCFSVSETPNWMSCPRCLSMKNL